MGEVAELSSVLEEEAAQGTFKGGQLVGRGLAVGEGAGTLWRCESPRALGRCPWRALRPADGQAREGGATITAWAPCWSLRCCKPHGTVCRACSRSMSTEGIDIFLLTPWARNQSCHLSQILAMDLPPSECSLWYPSCPSFLERCS